MEEIKIKGNLTTSLLNHQLAPFLEALSNIQHTIDEIKGREPSRIKIQSISSEKENDRDWRKAEFVGIPKNFSLEQTKKALHNISICLAFLEDDTENESIQTSRARILGTWGKVVDRSFSPLEKSPFTDLIGQVYSPLSENDEKIEPTKRTQVFISYAYPKKLQLLDETDNDEEYGEVFNKKIKARGEKK